MKWNLLILIIFSILVFTSCYTRTKLSINRLGFNYAITGKWYRGGGHISSYKGVVRPAKVDFYLSIYNNGRYKFTCNHFVSPGTFEVSGDTVTFILTPNKRARYLYFLDGHDLTFTKTDSVRVHLCMPSGYKDAFAGHWEYAH